MALHKKIFWIPIYLVVFCLTASISSFAGSASNQPGTTPTPTQKLLPDLTPISLSFDKQCNLMVKIRNAGEGKVSGHIDHALYVGGKIWGSGSFAGHVFLFPGSECTKQIPRAHLPAPETKWKCKLVLDPENDIHESNEENNSITKDMLCITLRIKEPKEN